MPENLEVDENELKKSINNLLWTFLPGETTFEEAEKIANDLFSQVRKHFISILSKNTGNA